MAKEKYIIISAKITENETDIPNNVDIIIENQLILIEKIIKKQ